MVEIDLAVFTDYWNVKGSHTSRLTRALVDNAFEKKKSVRVFSPRDCPLYIPLGRYTDKKLAISGGYEIWKLLSRNTFKNIYISTPNMPIGIASRITCRALGLPYSTTDKIKAPDYLVQLISDARSDGSSEIYREASDILLGLITR